MFRMSAADDDPRTNPVFVWLNDGRGGAMAQIWYRPFTGKGLRDDRILYVREMTNEHEYLTLDTLKALFPRAGRC